MATQLLCLMKIGFWLLRGTQHLMIAFGFWRLVYDAKASNYLSEQLLYLYFSLSKTLSPSILYMFSVAFLNSQTFLFIFQVNTAFVREQKLRLGTEVVAWSKAVIGEAEKPLVISGPSGVGKGTLISKLMEEFPSMFGFSVSHTTRSPRNNEQNGVHYHFTERNKMEKDIDNGKFLEFAAVHGNLYGTSVESVDVVADKGKVNLNCSCILGLKLALLAT